MQAAVQEGEAYHPEHLMQPQDSGGGDQRTQFALEEVTDISIRPFQKP